MATFPVIDLAPFLSPTSTRKERRAVALELDQACRNAGFFYLKGHGVPQDLLDNVRQHAIDFFETTSEDDKQRLALRSDDKARGYSRHVDAEKGSHEALDFYRPVEATGSPCGVGQGVNQWPTQPEDFRSVVETYVERMENLGRAVIEALALALGVDAKLFVSRVDEAFWQLRMIYYDRQTSPVSAKAGIGEHTDFGILTFLLADSTKGSLQVRSKTGEWMRADPIEGAFLCNLGDMLAEWTRGAYKSTAHRVVHVSDAPRISIPFFFDPNWDAFIEPVVPSRDGETEGRYVGVRYRDRFVGAMEEALVGVAALVA
ncbi:hypothetical protein LTR91_011080 [Friedmanniomyces endolithicus]|uniref:Fe2OG dioxygenase domain-containing protein n=1 Tax=Friedmanniomyces endolithicus TaxID=329885 RepID=A0AAN6FRG7_9PEZI|nr:hypothetical protein LTR35_005606 [Friedmanniomyces endolithicus]KAK0297635.1 hypothetical protein LTS00_003767 [Friedmanniomyces endolithicus]KAK0322109.1 hypothetical protein LTR82_007083 [Friedmanniomyces endolithicus]KAK0930694.1 hypothetical protein LTR57_001075 [Friedmanniomyces endolithicus]KAK0984020.1 hypothetical protein LTR91_011080 [Friedmanniomyces endolithicus]